MEAPAKAPLPYARTISAICCLTMGAGLVLWGVAPALTFRMATGHAPPPQAFLGGILSMILGGVYVILHLYIHLGARWPLQFGFGLSLVLITGTVGSWYLLGSSYTSSYILFLASAVLITSWLAMDADRRRDKATAGSI